MFFKINKHYIHLLGIFVNQKTWLWSFLSHPFNPRGKFIINYRQNHIGYAFIIKANKDTFIILNLFFPFGKIKMKNYKRQLSGFNSLNPS